MSPRPGAQPAPTVIRAADGRRMPWRNGGGETVEIAVHPPGADPAGWDWRISRAGVAADGPFSLFPGIDRTLAILDGAGLILAMSTRIPIGLLPTSDPLPFPADEPCMARLIGGPVTDLNVMTRRGRFAHTVRRLVLAGPHDLAPAAPGETLAAVCVDGALAVAGTTLERHDTLVASGADALRIAPARGATTLLLITLRAL